MTTNESNETPVDIAKVFADGHAIDEALRLAAQDARRMHKALGQRMAEWRDGKVVWIEPEDIVVELPDDDQIEEDPNEG